MIRVLLIDDEEIEYRLIRHMFKEKYQGDFVLEYAPTLEQASCLLKEHDFDIILLDDKLADGSNSVQNVPALRPLVKSTPLCIISKNIDAAHLRNKAILDVYDVVDKFNLRERLELGLVA